MSKIPRNGTLVRKGYDVLKKEFQPWEQDREKRYDSRLAHEASSMLVEAGVCRDLSAAGKVVSNLRAGYLNIPYRNRKDEPAPKASVSEAPEQMSLPMQSAKVAGTAIKGGTVLEVAKNMRQFARAYEPFESITVAAKNLSTLLVQWAKLLEKVVEGGAP